LDIQVGGFGQTVPAWYNKEKGWVDLWGNNEKDGVIMQFTGLLDKSKDFTEVYEGDIIGVDGLIKGNIYESPQIYKEGIDCLIEGMGTKKWRDTESVAMGRGCKYTE
jgi:hypothetical protein